MKGQLQVSTGSFALPDTLVTERVGVVGSSGYGKTHLLTVIAEELLEQNLPVVIIDPEGVFGGLRSSFDGKRPGYKIAVLGGREGDIALEPTAGKAIADVVVGTRQSMVLDLSNFEEEDEETAFVDDFCQRIYATNPRLPLHVIIDEIDKFAPETPTSKGQMKSMRSVKNLVQRGRNRALGTTMASQRPAVIKKDVLYQVRCLFAFNLGGPLDQEAIAKWMLRNAGLAKSERDEFMASLPKIPRGTAWCWSPAWLNTFEKVHIRERRTFDSSKTPELADLTRQRTKQQVDLSELQALMAATIEKSNEEDPEQLRRRIRELEATVQQGKAAAAPEIKEVPVMTPEQWDKLNQVAGQLKETVIGVDAAARSIRTLLTDVLTKLDAPVAAPRRIQPKVVPVSEPAPNRPRRTKRDPEPPPRPVIAPRIAVPGFDKASREIGVCELALLTAIAQRYPSTSTYAQVSLISGYSKNSSSFKNGLTALRQSGFIVGDKKTPISITDAGREAVPHVPPLPNGAKLLAYWRDQLDKCPSALLGEIAKVYPRSYTKDELSEATKRAGLNDGEGYSTNSSSFKNSLTKLRKLGLITGFDDLKASDNLFDTTRRRAAS